MAYGTSDHGEIAVVTPEQALTQPAESVPLSTPAPHRSGAAPRRTQLRGSTLLTRVGEGPLLEPTTAWWESRAVFNPGVVEGPDGTIHVLYRAQGRDGISRFGYARTRDGVTIEARSPDPVYEPDIHDELERIGTEDPRIVRIGNLYLVTYTAASLYRSTDPHPQWLPEGEPPWRVRIALAATEDFRTFLRLGVLLPDVDNKDGVLFPERVGNRYLLLHRFPPDMWLATSTDLRHWEGHQIVLRTRPALWDERKLGAGPPPVRTSRGWLFCYHGVDHHNVYRAGFALLDLEDPRRVLGRSQEPALEPLVSWEVTGQVPRVVFPTGMVLRGDELLVYYGAADTVIGVARGSLQQILAALV